MKTKRLIPVFAGLLALLPLGSTLAAKETVSYRKDVLVAAGETQDKVFSLGGSILVEGKVDEDVMAIGGTITISGEVGQSVVGIGSRIIVKSTAVVGKDLVALGGTLEKEPGCTVRGDTVYFESAEIGDRIFKDGFVRSLFSLSFLPVILLIKAIIIFLWFAVALVGAALFPKPLALASDRLRTSFWPSLGVGILATVIFTALVIFCALLSLVLIGIPLLMAVTAAGLIIKIFGRLVVFYFLGDSLLRALGSRRTAAVGAVLLGLLVFSLVGFIPVIGFLFSFVLNMVGWGIAIRTKFGTTENWFQRKPAA